MRGLLNQVRQPNLFFVVRHLPNPRMWGRVHTLSSHHIPCIGVACSHLVHPHRPVYWGAYFLALHSLPPRLPLFETCPTRVSGVCSHLAPPHHPVHLRGVSTACAPTPPRALGACPHPEHPHNPVRWRACSHPARPPPRTLGRVHTLRAHTAPCIGGRVHTLRFHTTPCIGAHTSSHYTLCPRSPFARSPFAPPTLCPASLCSRLPPPTRYEKTHAAVRFVGRLRSI